MSTLEFTTPLEDPADAFTELISVDGEFFRRNAKGGGLVAVTARVAPSAYVDRAAIVRGHAVLAGSARLFGNAIVEDYALIGGMTTLRDNARVGGKAVLVGGVIVREDGYVGGNARLEGAVVVEGKARLTDQHLRGRLTIR